VEQTILTQDLTRAQLLEISRRPDTVLAAAGGVLPSESR